MPTNFIAHMSKYGIDGLRRLYHLQMKQKDDEEEIKEAFKVCCVLAVSLMC